MVNLPTLKTKDVAQILKMHPNTIRNLVRDKQITAYKYGRGYHFYTEDVQKFIEQRKSQ